MKNWKCLIGRHDYVWLNSLNLKPKLPGRLKKTLDDFDVCPLDEATYFVTNYQCKLCSKIKVEIT